MDNNPYSATSSFNQPVYNQGDGRVSASVVREFAGTKVWVKLVSVMMFISAGFVILGGIGLLFLGGRSGLPSFVGVLYIVMSLLYVFPASKLWKYGSAIQQLSYDSSERSLALAAAEQRRFWKFVGILIVISIGFMLLVMVGGLIAGMARA